MHVCSVHDAIKRGKKWRYQTGNDLVNNASLCTVHGIFIKRPFNVILNIFVPDFKHIAHRCVLFYVDVAAIVGPLLFSLSIFRFSGSTALLPHAFGIESFAFERF